MRIALAQINPTVGDIAGNASLIKADIEKARDLGAQLVVFPELSIIGYPPKDLLLKPAVVEECVAAVEDLARLCEGITAIIGYPAPNESPDGRSLFNAAAVCEGGRIAKRHVKSLLPTYDVFDELRYFEPGPEVDLTELPSLGVKLGISICEDLWNEREMFTRRLYHDNPIDKLAGLGADLFVNSSASPFVTGKHEFRRKLMSRVASRNRIPLLYCNQVGGNDELVFDGNSCAFDSDGNLIGQAKDFEPDLLIVDVDPQQTPTAASRVETPKDGLEAAYHALVLGLRDYCRKCGFKSVVIGLSGGIDSSLVGALAAAALGSENVRGISNPSRYSSQGSKSDAQKLAENLGITFHTIPIDGPHRAFEELLNPYFEGRAPDVTEENIQARIRGLIWMAFSNKLGSLVLTNGNKSELAVGYCTLYGDMAGGLAVINDVPKTMVYELARWINDDPASPLRQKYGKAVIPQDSITKPPSAELRPGQTDQQSLPPYEVLDEIIDRYVEREQSARRIVDETGFEPEVVLKMIRLIDLSEYKRRQAAPGLKITGRAFGFGRRMPIAQRYDSRRSLTVRAGGVERMAGESAQGKS